MNKNDSPLVCLSEASKVEIKNFKHFNEFEKICSLFPDKTREKIEIVDIIDKVKVNRKGLVYCFVFNGIVLKVGSSTTNIKNRIQSYNCGKKAYRESGTCSTTNYFVLQTLLNFNVNIEVYAFFPEIISFDVFGKKTETSLPAKKYEKVILTKMKEDGCFPSLCTQT